jgi:hypothetical protein
MKNKGIDMKNILLATLILTTLILAACSSASTSNQTEALSAQSELLLGTLKLESTEQAVTNEQATELLPLWQLMTELQSSARSAQQEKNAVLDQIKGVMTSNQKQAITDMKLTSQDATSFIQKQNISVSSNQTASKSIQSQSGPAGDFPAGGPPGGDPMGGIIGGGISVDLQTQSLTQSTSGQNAQAQSTEASQISASLMDALIKLLEKKGAS